MTRKPFWISIRKAKDCLFSRREGWQGRVIHGYSIVIILFGLDLLQSRVKKQFTRMLKESREEDMSTKISRSNFLREQLDNMFIYGRSVSFTDKNGETKISHPLTMPEKQ